MFNVQSPYTQLSDSLFGPQAAARSRGFAGGQAARGADVNRHLRPPGRGVSASIGDATSGLGAAAAGRAVAPLAQRISDDRANAGWALGKQNANEQFGNAMVSRLANSWAANNNPTTQWQMLGSFGGLMDSLFS